MRFIVTGANRGIGLELVRQITARGDTAVAAVRDPSAARELHSIAASIGREGALRIEPCDVASDESVGAFAASINDSPVDVLINNAGVMGKLTSLDAIDIDDALRTISVNAGGALRVTRALLPLIRRGGGRKLVHITSGMGSIGDNTSGGAYGYRMSKAALNMASRSMAIDLRSERIISVVMNPGWVQTDMGGHGAPTPVADSARGILAIVDRLTIDDSGKFFDFRGHTIEW